MKATSYKCVFRCFLKVSTVPTDLASKGRYLSSSFGAIFSKAHFEFSPKF
uniref:Uncharacterized protein n=1 Tax=Anguilla anguilla TaxID=7936 RepID=A0A0E9WKH8_ANGAN